MISQRSSSSKPANEYAVLDGSAPTDKNRRTEPLIRVAQYVRMSTEHQQYSIDNQSIIINDFAKKNGMKIVKTYSDDSKSVLYAFCHQFASLLNSAIYGGVA